MRRHISSLYSRLAPHIAEVLSQSTTKGKEGWKKLLAIHHSDIADIAENLRASHQKKLFENLPLKTAAKTFEQLTHLSQIEVLELLEQDRAAHILRHIHTNDVVSILEHMDDDRMKHFLKLIQKKQRSRIISLMSFEEKSAGSIMNSEVLTLQSDVNVKKCIGLLQRLKPHTEVRYRLYVTDAENVIVGYITLDQLVLNKSDTPLSKLIHKPDLLINAHEDQESAVQKMTHYDILSAPVVDEYNHFLGILTADDAIEVLEEEASEDVYKMSGVGAVAYSYFETPLRTMFFQRSKWLLALLLFQSVSSLIMKQYDALLTSNVIISLFLTMLIGTGGNAGNQSATLVIRGLATGEIPHKKGLLVLLREIGLGLLIATTLAIVSFARVYIMHHHFAAAIAISISLFCIVMTSMILGALIPLTLERLGIDPAHSAAPFLATLMDIIGIMIYCVICSYML